MEIRSWEQDIGSFKKTQLDRGRRAFGMVRTRGGM